MWAYRSDNKLPSASKRRGFTLLELLLVIGIVVILVSILLPAVRTVRISAQKVATAELLNRITQGCEAYFQDFGAFPGPFADGQMAGDVEPFTGTPEPPLTFPGTTVRLGVSGKEANGATVGTPVQLTKAPTSSENLFVGLCGGLRVIQNPAGTAVTQYYFDQESVRASPGPRGLNQALPKKYQSYFQLQPGDYSGDATTSNPIQPATALHSGAPPAGENNLGMWWRRSGQTIGDTEIFEFVDKFRTPMPILYMRAARGSTPFLSDDLSGNGQLESPPEPSVGRHYNLFQVTRGYASVKHTTRKKDPNTIYSYDADSESPTNKYWHANELDFPELRDSNNNVILPRGNFRYFGNDELSKVGQPIVKHRDGFILISAGPDGIYGTADDIRN